MSDMINVIAGSLGMFGRLCFGEKKTRAFWLEYVPNGGDSPAVWCKLFIVGSSLGPGCSFFVGVCFWDHHLTDLSLSACLCFLMFFCASVGSNEMSLELGRNPEDQTEPEDPNAHRANETTSRTFIGKRLEPHPP